MPANKERFLEMYQGGGSAPTPQETVSPRMQKVINEKSPGLVSKVIQSWTVGAGGVAEDIGEAAGQYGPKAVRAGIIGGVPAVGLFEGAAEAGKIAGKAAVSGLETLAGGPKVPGGWTEEGGYVPEKFPRYTGGELTEGIGEGRPGGGYVRPGGALEAPKAPPITRTYIDEEGVVRPGATPVSEGPMRPTVSTFDRGAGYTPGGSEVVPTGGGGYQGFIDSEMARIEKDRAEYESYRKGKEQETLAGLGPEGEERLRKRIQSFEPYLKGVSKGRSARIMGGFLESLMKSEDEARKSLISTRATTEATTTAAAMKAGAARDVAYTKAQTEAKKLGIDLAKLGIEQQKLGLEGAKADVQIKEGLSRIQNMMHGQQVEELKLALQGTKDATERKKIRLDHFAAANKVFFTEKMKNWRTRHQFNPNSPEALAEAEEITQEFTRGDEILRFLNPQEEDRDPFTGKSVRRGGKWVDIGTEE